MNPLVLMPFVLIVVPFLPTFMEIFRRRDKGPREIPEQTTYEEKPDVEVPRLERARSEARAKEPGEVIRVTGNISIPDGTEVGSHLIVQGNLRLGKNCRVHGSVKTFGSVEIGEHSIIEGHVLSGGDVHIERESKVRGVVDSVQEVILGENAVVEAVSTEKTVKLGPGAKINKRIVSGTSIVTFPEQPSISKVGPPYGGTLRDERPSVTLKQIQPVRPAEEKLMSREAIPRYELPRLEEPGTKTEKITDQIFWYLEDPIRKIDETRSGSIEGLKLEELGSKEVKVLNVAYTCSSLEEVCLRLLMDPPEVQEILNGLIMKGYLDKNLKPKKPEAGEGSQAKVPEKVHELKTRELEPSGTETKKTEEKVRGTSKDEWKPPDNEATKPPSTEKKDLKNILGEREKISSLVWGAKEKKKRHDSTYSRSQNIEQTRTLVGKDSRIVLDEIRKGESSKNEESEEVTHRSERIEKRSFTYRDSSRFFGIAFKRMLKSARLGNIVAGRIMSRGTFFLAILTLTALFLAEISYYNPNSVVLWESILPFNFTVWSFFLALAIGFGIMSGLTTLKCSNQRRTLNDDFGGKIRSG